MRLKDIREERELKQEDVAQILEVSRSSYAMWEAEKDMIPLIRLNDFCNYFGVSLDYALGFTDIKNYPHSKLELDQKKLAERLKVLRKESSFTQLKLSKKLNITRSLISKYENSNHLILTSFLMEYSRYYNLSCDYLVGKIEEKIKLKPLIKI